MSSDPQLYYRLKSSSVTGGLYSLFLKRGHLVTSIRNALALNPQQESIVRTTAKNSLVLAGAGSGKTRVLVHRIHWLLLEKNVLPDQILAVTFSNKAARELKDRVEKLVKGQSMVPGWIGTFHGIAHRLLRIHAQAAGLPDLFTILDGDDQIKLVQRLIRQQGLDEQLWAAKRVVGYINRQKEEGKAPILEHVPSVYAEKVLNGLYQTYQQHCYRAGLIDFSELLLRACRLWSQNPEILERYHARFSHVLIDEFQDTNQLQYYWLSLLRNPRTQFMAVGDDDQSIYGWRGARVGNLQKFLEEFEESHLIRLEQNYRSTPIILSAANGLIAHNRQRFSKQLWSAATEGEKITVACLTGEQEEAQYVAEKIAALSREKWQHCAILYRNNAQSRAFEEALIHTGLPYQVYGGLKFFDRQEIKDALAYLKLLVNRHDDLSFERVVNTPARGFGAKSLEQLKHFALEQRLSLWSAMLVQLQPLQAIPKLFSTRTLGALAAFAHLIDMLEEAFIQLPLPQAIEDHLKRSGLWQHYENANLPTGSPSMRLENLAELITAAQYFMENYAQAEPQRASCGQLQEFLSHVALDAQALSSQQGQEGTGVHLMTLHAAKGLEFECVFMVGLEEGLFPSFASQVDEERLEEERRLAYVGITRAKHKLTLTYTLRRRLYGKTNYYTPSRFFKEIPIDLLVPDAALSTPDTFQVGAVPHRRSERAGPLMPRTESQGQRADLEFRAGQRVHHTTFGAGSIKMVNGQGEQMRLRVEFDRVGEKWLMARLAKLTLLNAAS